MRQRSRDAMNWCKNRNSPCHAIRDLSQKIESVRFRLRCTSRTSLTWLKSSTQIELFLVTQSVTLRKNRELAFSLMMHVTYKFDLDEKSNTENFISFLACHAIDRSQK